MSRLFHLWINYVIIYLMIKYRALLIGSIDIYLSDKLLHSLSEGGIIVSI